MQAYVACVCAHVCIHVCECVCVCVHMGVIICTCVYMRVLVCMCTCIIVACVYVYACVHVCMCMLSCEYKRYLTSFLGIQVRRTWQFKNIKKLQIVEIVIKVFILCKCRNEEACKECNKRWSKR